MSRLEPLLKMAMRRGWNLGVRGGSRFWTVAGGLATVGWLAGRALAREEEVVFRDRLLPGQSLRITHEGGPGGEGRS